MKKQAITKLLSIILFLGLSFGLVSCLETKQDPEKELKSKELTAKTDALHLKLGKLMADPNGINPKAVEETLKSIRDTTQALSDLKSNGGSWYDIGKGALVGVFGRTLLHTLRTALIAFFPVSGGGGIAGLIGMALGGSGTGSDKKKII